MSNPYKPGIPEPLGRGAVNSNKALCQLIASRIAETPQRQIAFAEYMDLVLYHPQHGYYATNAVNIGAQGDFFTSPHLGADFGELLAEQFVQMWNNLGYPAPFTLLEMGAGQGILAADILRYLHKRYPDFFNALEYAIVEKASGLIAEQRHILQQFPETEGRVSWRTWQEIPSASIIGCCFSNELVDALPVHQFTIAGGQLREIYVTAQPGSGGEQEQEIRFQEVMGEPSTPKLAEYFELVGINLFSGTYADGYRSEVNLAALDWLSVVADRMQRGYLITIDYGYPSFRYYNPARSQGTLQCYYRHRHHSDPYVHVGHQDITAHVDFTALERQGELCGLQKVGFTQQGLFLMALGMGDRIAALSTTDATKAQDIQQVLRRRDALHQLIDPQGLGGFGTLVQSKGLSEKEKGLAIKGLTIPSS